MNGSYTFGDSALAATRLALLAEVFRDTTAGLLAQLQVRRSSVAVDLGCGPGFTTVLVRDQLAPRRLIAVDSSPAFVREAAHRLRPNGEVLCADVVDLPGLVHDADLIFARFLLTHLAEPVAAIEHWLGRLAPAGLVAMEEVESITTDEPILNTYLELQRRMLEAHGARLEIGPVIQDAALRRGGVQHSDVVFVSPSMSVVARMFAMNFANWRARPLVRELASAAELDEIEAGLTGLASTEARGSSITWQLRQLVLAAA